MIKRVKKAFVFNDIQYRPGQLIKLGTRDFKELEDKVEDVTKFTKEVSNKRIK